MPKKAKRKGNEFSVGYEDILLDDQASAYGKMDALGRFMVKIPLLNVSEVFMDLGRRYVHTFLEPGETYFFFCDFIVFEKLIKINSSPRKCSLSPIIFLL